jgi:NAD+ synthase
MYRAGKDVTMTETAAVDRALADQIAAWLREHLEMTGAERFVLGLSGGIDSAVVCALCSKAAGPEAVLGAIMPSHSATLDAEHARLVAATFGVTAVEIDLTATTEALLAALPGDNEPVAADDEAAAARARLATANIRPRLRMTTLYALANRYNGLVVGTGNKTEARLGYFTKYGDGGVDLLPIVDLYKREVRALARELGVPDVIIDKAPSAGLWPGQTDESELGATYAQLDAAFMAMDSNLPVEDRALHERVLRLERGAAHKRSPIPAFRRS